MRKNLKNDTGVTLIALVVTVVVLLILAAVNLAFLTGDSGVISKAKEAAKATNLSNTAERIAIDLTLETTISENGTVDTDKLKTIISNHGGELDDDGDTIHTDDGDLSLEDIMGGDITSENKDEKIRELEKLIEELREKIRELEEQNREKDELIEELKRQLAEKEAELEDLRRQLEEANAEIDRLKDQIAQLEAEIADLKKTIEDLTAQLEAANATIAELQKTIESLKAQIADLQKQLDNANATIAELRKKQATGNAIEANVLAGKTFSNSTGVGLTGTMPNLSSNSKITHTSSNETKVLVGDAQFLSTNSDGVARYQIRYNGTPGYITGNTLFAFPASNLGNAAQSQVLSGKTFTSSNGLNVSGTMVDRSSTIQTATTSTSNRNASCYRINGSNIEVVPANGYWGNWNWGASCIRVPRSDISTNGVITGKVQGTHLGWVYQHGPNITAKLDATYSIPSGTSVKLVCFTSGGFVGIWTSDEPNVIRTGCQNHTMQFHGSYAVDGNFKVTNTQATFPVVSWDNNSANWNGEQGTFYVVYSR